MVVLFQPLVRVLFFLVLLSMMHIVLCELTFKSVLFV